jgi:alpha-1,6-mannosyltransferase
VIAAQQPDVVEAGDPYRLAWAALDAARACRVPSVLFCHSDIAILAAHTIERCGFDGASTRRLARNAAEGVARYLAHLCSGFDIVLAPSRATQRGLIAAGVTHALHQPLGVDTEVFSPRARDERWRAALALPADARLVLYVGRFAPEKNLPQLVAAIDRLGARYHLLALGAGPQPPAGARVHVLEFEAQPALVARAMASVDAVVHAGDQETGGLAVLEAMACGTPVVVRNAGGLGETVAGGCGLAVDSGRAEVWAEAIEAACADNRATVAAGLARAHNHEWAAVLALLQRRYAAAMQGGLRTRAR